VTIGAQAVGIAQGALDYALGYVKERKQFGKAIAEFQGLQFMLADMAMELEAARRWSTSRRPSPSATTPTCLLRRGRQVLRLRRGDEGHH
jgi:alkylation response protein AidB-like acyl-CoA dehydrogenase